MVCEVGFIQFECVRVFNIKLILVCKFYFLGCYHHAQLFQYHGAESVAGSIEKFIGHLGLHIVVGEAEKS